MSRPRGSSRKGQRVYDIKPFYRGCRVTIVGEISQTSILAMQTLELATQLREWFETLSYKFETHNVLRRSGLAPMLLLANWLPGCVKRLERERQVPLGAKFCE